MSDGGDPWMASGCRKENVGALLQAKPWAAGAIVLSLSTFCEGLGRKLRFNLIHGWRMLNKNLTTPGISPQNKMMDWIKGKNKYSRWDFSKKVLNKNGPFLSFFMKTFEKAFGRNILESLSRPKNRHLNRTLCSQRPCTKFANFTKGARVSKIYNDAFARILKVLQPIFPVASFGLCLVTYLIWRRIRFPLVQK